MRWQLKQVSLRITLVKSWSIKFCYSWNGMISFKWIFKTNNSVVSKSVLLEPQRLDAAEHYSKLIKSQYQDENNTIIVVWEYVWYDRLIFEWKKYKLVLKYRY